MSLAAVAPPSLVSRGAFLLSQPLPPCFRGELACCHSPLPPFGCRTRAPTCKKNLCSWLVPMGGANLNPGRSAV